MLHHQITVWLRTKTPTLGTIYAGAAPPKVPAPYIIVDSSVLTDNGETHAGQLRTKVYTQIIDVYHEESLFAIEATADRIKDYLSVRQFAIGVAGTGYWIQSATLKSEIPMDMQKDPEGRPMGLAQIRLIYNIAARRI